VTYDLLGGLSVTFLRVAELQYKNSFMQPYISEQFEAMMAEEELYYQSYENYERYEFGVTCKNGSWQMVVTLKHTKALFVVNCIAPFRLVHARKIAIDDLLHRINHEFAVGHFAVSYEMAEIRLVLAIPVYTNEDIRRQMRKALFGAVNRFNKYLPAILNVNFGEADPALAFIEIHQ
jgi:hypothetical protein